MLEPSVFIYSLVEGKEKMWQLTDLTSLIRVDIYILGEHILSGF